MSRTLVGTTAYRYYCKCCEGKGVPPVSRSHFDKLLSGRTPTGRIPAVQKKDKGKMRWFTTEKSLLEFVKGHSGSRMTKQAASGRKARVTQQRQAPALKLAVDEAVNQAVRQAVVDFFQSNPTYPLSLALETVKGHASTKEVLGEVTLGEIFG